MLLYSGHHVLVRFIPAFLAVLQALETFSHSRIRENLECEGYAQIQVEIS